MESKLLLRCSFSMYIKLISEIAPPNVDDLLHLSNRSRPVRGRMVTKSIEAITTGGIRLITPDLISK